jgi:hypothetical protein
MRVVSVQNAFVSGELSPNMYGRTNLESYQKSGAQLRNVYVTPQGGCPRREGLQYVDQTTNNAKNRLVSFEFNTEQVYLISYTPAEMKVYKNDQLVATVKTGPIANITAKILDEMNYTQSADTLILAHEDLQTANISRTSDTVWTAANVAFTNIPQYNYGAGNEAVFSVTRGWPRSVAFKFGRLWLGGLKSRPQTILASKTGDFFNLNVGTALDEDAINVTIDDDRVNAIINMFPGRTLQLFTKGGEFTIQAALTDPVTPGKIAEQLKKATLHGCNRTRPVSVDGSTIFVEGSGQVVRQFTYNDVEQSYNSPNISLLSSHLIRKPVRMDVRRATEAFPADYVYLVNSDGTMAVLNILRDEQLLAWSLFETDGRFEDVCVVGNDVYVTVQRNINGNLVRYIEKFNNSNLTDASKRQTVQVYSNGMLGQTISEPTTAWAGFGHLEGEEIKVLGDRFVLDNEVVTNGGIVSSESVLELEVGLNFKALVETLPAELIIGGQSKMGDYKRMVYANLRLLNSRGVIVKQKNGQVYKPVFRQFGESVLDKPVELFTGWKKVYLGGIDRDSQVIITQEDPLEFNLLALSIGLGV